MLDPTVGRGRAWPSLFEAGPCCRPRSRRWAGNRPDSHATHRGGLARTLMSYVQDSLESDNIIHATGPLGYLLSKSEGYEHEVTPLKGTTETPSELSRRIRLVVPRLNGGDCNPRGSDQAISSAISGIASKHSKKTLPS